MKEREDHDIGGGEQELLGLVAGGFRSASDKAEVAATCKLLQLVEAYAREGGDLVSGKNLLTGLNLNHGTPSLHLMMEPC